MLGGNAGVVAIAFASAVSIDRLQIVMSRRRLPFFYQQVAGGAVATIAGCAGRVDAAATSTSRWWSPRTSSCCSPGSASWAPCRTRLSGFYLTAGARLTEALLATAGIIAGVSGGLTFADVIGVEHRRARPGLGDSLKSVSLMAPRGGHLGGGVRVLVVRAAPDARSRSRSSPPWPWRSRSRRRSSASAAPGRRRSRRSSSVWSASPSPAGCGCRPWWSWSPRSCRCCPVSRSTAGCPCWPRAAPYVSLGLLALITAASVALALSAGVILGEYVAQPLKREASAPREPAGRSAPGRSAAAPNRSSQARWVGPSKGSGPAVTAAEPLRGRHRRR